MSTTELAYTTIAEQMLDGSLCEACGDYLGEGDGVPTRCAGCQPELPIPVVRKRTPTPIHPGQLTQAQQKALLDALATRGGGLAPWKCAGRDLKRLLKLELLELKKGIHRTGGVVLYVPSASGKKLAAELQRRAA